MRKEVRASTQIRIFQNHLHLRESTLPDGLKLGVFLILSARSWGILAQVLHFLSTWNLGLFLESTTILLTQRCKALTCSWRISVGQKVYDHSAAQRNIKTLHPSVSCLPECQEDNRWRAKDCKEQSSGESHAQWASRSVQTAKIRMPAWGFSLTHKTNES